MSTTQTQTRRSAKSVRFQVPLISCVSTPKASPNHRLQPAHTLRPLRQLRIPRHATSRLFWFATLVLLAVAQLLLLVLLYRTIASTLKAGSLEATKKPPAAFLVSHPPFHHAAIAVRSLPSYFSVAVDVLIHHYFDPVSCCVLKSVGVISRTALLQAVGGLWAWFGIREAWVAVTSLGVAVVLWRRSKT